MTSRCPSPTSTCSRRCVRSTESAPLRPQAVATPAKPRTEVVVQDEDSSARLIARADPEPPAAGRDQPGVNLAAASRVCADLARVMNAGDVSALLTQSGRDPRCARRDRVGRRQAGRLAVPDVHARLSRRQCWCGWAPSRPTPTTPRRRRGARANWWPCPASADSPGALVTPIITADGCVGVLAAELRQRPRACAKTFVRWPRSSPRNSRPSSRRWPRSARPAWSTASPPSEPGR